MICESMLSVSQVRMDYILLIGRLAQFLKFNYFYGGGGGVSSKASENHNPVGNVAFEQQVRVWKQYC